MATREAPEGQSEEQTENEEPRLLHDVLQLALLHLVVILERLQNGVRSRSNPSPLLLFRVPPSSVLTLLPRSPPLLLPPSARRTGWREGGSLLRRQGDFSEDLLPPKKPSSKPPIPSKNPPMLS